jgi:hypothetical protein
MKFDDNYHSRKHLQSSLRCGCAAPALDSSLQLPLPIGPKPPSPPLPTAAATHRPLLLLL